MPTPLATPGSRYVRHLALTSRVAKHRTEDLDPNVIGTQIVAALQRAQKELEAGALLTIEADRTRLRVLPFAIEP